MNFLRPCILLFLRILSSVLGQQQTGDGCFTQYDNVKDVCTKAFQQKTGISQQECTNLCLQSSTCKAANYDSNKQQCNLFREAGKLPQIGRKKRSHGRDSGKGDHSKGGRGKGWDGPGGPGKGGGGPGKGGGGHHGGGHHGGGHSHGGGHRRSSSSSGSRERPKCDSQLQANNPGFIYYISTGTCSGGATSAPITSPVTQCPIVRRPQKLLVGYAEAVVTATSFDDCFQQCSNSQARFGFSCASGMFYSTESSKNCILNSESANTQPTLFIDEANDNVEYFEPCPTQPLRLRRGVENLKQSRRRNVIWLNTTSWGSWTRCDDKASNRVRYRQCKSFNPNKCETSDATCDPKNRQKEMLDIQMEEKSTPPPNSNERQSKESKHN